MVCYALIGNYSGPAGDKTGFGYPEFELPPRDPRQETEDLKNHNWVSPIVTGLHCIY